jgi:hypothetical protein
MIGENRQKKANGGKLVFFLFFLPFYSEKQKELFYSSPFSLLETKKTKQNTVTSRHFPLFGVLCVYIV